MDVIIAAIKMQPLLWRCRGLPHTHEEYGIDHLQYMCREIISGSVTGEKAHRWLGWIQACVCIGKGATLEELKQINLRSQS